MDIGAEYKQRWEQYLKPIANKLQEKLLDELKDVPRVDRVSARAKDPTRFMNKSQKSEGGRPKYNDPLVQIQDQIGARVIVFYVDDVIVVEKAIEDYYRHIEKKDLVPESDSEFGYVGKHYVLKLPEDVIEDEDDKTKIPKFFELQIKTLFQHAWSEANHDLGYKPDQELTSHHRRKLAFTAAQAWGADQIFSELLRDLDA
ncbi:GTP pyrophosphokinase [Saccharophagus degradans]|uniref:RelA/SpoT domain-containing protein n=1 Tax=Saccharophagus degradans TaxID=86304 RepID=A0AAW7X3V9_9GAMM|nr:RelA/SpoT domain-containing protein [Saccharophagus degradans]MDO6421552.1 RelA/SpoT domain-containing protein [Saccharophagus degradans]MDO6608514.1 RelA/SpoT domain-containing protein [Saccharophagus degradans]